MPSRAFLAAVRVVLDMERGFQADPEDTGNWTGGAKGRGELKGTNFGISAAAYPDLDIKALTKEQALEIYERDYWVPVRGDELPYPVALVLFDIKVNGGRPVEWLQQAVGGIAVDGVLGPVTLAAAGRVADTKALAARILRRRVLYYTTLGNFSRYGGGWIQRCFDVYRAAVEGIAT